MVVTFDNDETFSQEIRHRFDERSKSRVIDLPGSRRAIKRIDFNDRSGVGRGKATVEVYARTSLKSACLILYDEQQKKLISFRALRLSQRVAPG
jgi:hypothetical protein